MGATALWALQDDLYIKPAKQWATVTPLLLDYFPKERKGLDTVKIIRLACTRIGLPEPIRIEFGSVSWLRGAPVSYQFGHRYKKGLPPHHRVHAWLEFSEKVRGPILLCAGRYIGLGLCRHWHGAQQGGKP